MRVVDLGLISFSDALALQEAAVQEVLDGGEERLFVLEHTPVVTFGRHGGEAFLRFSPDELRSQGIDCAKATRGGSVTCHFPGQAVLYPVSGAELTCPENISRDAFVRQAGRAEELFRRPGRNRHHGAG